jgi:predicted nucleic acid-binding protein
VAADADVLVDTSIWVDFLHGRDDVVAELTALIRAGRVVVCGQILQEVLQGSRDEKAFSKLEKQMSLWPAEIEEPRDFVEAARIFAHLRWRGIAVPPTDCLVAAVARRRELRLYANDSDFDQIPGLTRYAP